MSNNFINIFVAKRRWLNRKVGAFLSDTAWINLRNGFKFFLDPKDLYGPSFHVVYSGDKGFDNYEKIDKDEIVTALPDDGVFFDIGANIGIFTYYVKQKLPNTTVHCFEPHPLLKKCLNDTKNSNEISGVHIHNIGLSDESGEFKLFLSNINGGGHSFEMNADDKDESRHVIVQVETLDDFCQKNSITKIDVIKIDVEGIEEKVLAGAVETLKKYKPCLLIECNNQELANETGIIDLFKNSDFDVQFKRPGEDKFRTLSSIKESAILQLNLNKELDTYLFKIL